MTYSLTQGTTVGANNEDVDFIAYGPYSATTFTNGTACSSLTGGCSGDHACSGNIIILFVLFWRASWRQF